jgi:hypothetical protein
LIDSQVAECRARISALEERTEHHDDQVAALQTMLSNALKRFETDLMRLATEVKAVRDAQNSDSPLPAASAPPATASAADDAQKQLGSHEDKPGGLDKVDVATVEQMRVDIATLKNWRDSLIVSEYPPLFEEFRMKTWTMLWRGSRDGFTAKEFHRRCDGRANTLTLILDTDRNVFGGFTPVKWESSASGKWKGADSLRSFLFTLRNPHGVPPRKFALKADKKDKVCQFNEKATWRYARNQLLMEHSSEEKHNEEKEVPSARQSCD